ncbi:hypothetical protein CRG98_038294 [Punica granatum]|uniref:Uncharacterized protein n=1 Tax=Punica granatum TaxID=22663 RepID=A0A2I0IBD9_PUNGR|nr:hypothetical protein CRG98_038294 [Punica granatum]
MRINSDSAYDLSIDTEKGSTEQRITIHPQVHHELSGAPTACSDAPVVRSDAQPLALTTQPRAQMPSCSLRHLAARSDAMRALLRSDAPRARPGSDAPDIRQRAQTHAPDPHPSATDECPRTQTCAARMRAPMQRGLGVSTLLGTRDGRM